MPLTATAASLAEVLDELTAEGATELTEQLPKNALKCYACGHRCVINEGKRGICKVRFNAGGHLRVPANYVAALACDPTEKKPFFHALPGSDTLTFGMLGCDLHCAYCQNWLTSQALRDDAAAAPPNVVAADRLIAMAKAYGASMVGSSYNEPLITAEWAVEVFKKAKARGERGGGEGKEALLLHRLGGSREFPDGDGWLSGAAVGRFSGAPSRNFGGAAAW